MEQSVKKTLNSILKSEAIDFFQYVFRPKMEHIGGIEIYEEELRLYIPDAIKGFTNMSQAMELKPINLCCDIDKDTKVTYSLQLSHHIDWLKNGRVIQVGILHKNVHFKIYEFIFGFALHTRYGQNEKGIEKAKKNGNFYYAISAFQGINELLSKIKWSSDSYPSDDFPMLTHSSLISHAPNAKAEEVLECFIAEKTLYVSPMFGVVMTFAEDVPKVDARKFDIERIHFSTEYPVEQTFFLPDVTEITTSFIVDEENKSFILGNKNLFIYASKLNFKSKMVENLKEENLKNLATKPCLIVFRQKDKSGSVVSNEMNFRLLKDKWRKDKKLNHRHIKKVELSFAQAEWLKEKQGETIGFVDWFEQIEAFEKVQPEHAE